MSGKRRKDAQKTDTTTRAPTTAQRYEVRPQQTTTSLEAWCASLYAEGVDLHARAIWVDGYSFSGPNYLQEQKEIRVYGNIAAVPPFRHPEHHSISELLEWWEKQVCKPNNLPFELAVILRRAQRMRDLLEERNQLQTRIEAIDEALGTHCITRRTRMCDACREDLEEQIEALVVPDELRARAAAAFRFAKEEIGKAVEDQPKSEPMV